MKPYRIFISLIIFTAVLCHSCERSDFMPADVDEIIVEGWIEEGQYPVVMLTRALPVRLKDDEVDLNRINDFVVMLAKVTVSNGKDKVVLIGRPDSHYMPSYIYTTINPLIKGEAGKTYTLRVETLGKVLTSKTTIPLYPPAVDSVVCSPTSIDNLSAITAYVSNIPGRKEYFKTFFRQGTDKKQYLSAYMGAIDDALADSTMVIPIIKSIKDDNKDDRSRYYPNDSVVSIKVSAIDSVSYAFWKSYSDNSSLGSLSSYIVGSTFQEIPTNIKGGRGYWCGYNSFVHTFHVRPGVFPGNR